MNSFIDPHLDDDSILSQETTHFSNAAVDAMQTVPASRAASQQATPAHVSESGKYVDGEWVGYARCNMDGCDGPTGCAP